MRDSLCVMQAFLLSHVSCLLSRSLDIPHAYRVLRDDSWTVVVLSHAGNWPFIAAAAQWSVAGDEFDACFAQGSLNKAASHTACTYICKLGILQARTPCCLANVGNHKTDITLLSTRCMLGMPVSGADCSA
jgi:hypothetical protein